MRCVSLVLLTLGAAGLNTARAADLDEDFLRGPQYEAPLYAPVIDFSGFYIGGHGGYSSTSLGFRNTGQPIVADYLRQTVVETEMKASGLLTSSANRRVGGTSYGAFAGFNVQFDQAVLGIEADYTHFGLSGGVFDAIGRTMTTSDGYFNIVGLSSGSQTRIQDYGTVRARAGYAFGNLLPFVTGGAAIGSAQVSDRVTVQTAGYDQATYRANQTPANAAAPAYVNNYGYSHFSQTNPGAGVLADPYVYSRTKTKVVAGIALGAGLEYAITPGILLRAEYQYVLFNDFDGHKANVNTVRGGAALKF